MTYQCTAPQAIAVGQLHRPSECVEAVRFVLVSVSLDHDIWANSKGHLHEPGVIESQIGNENVSLDNQDGSLEFQQVI